METSEFKEDIIEAKERLIAWWDQEIIDRPVFSYYYPTKRGKLGAYLDIMGEDWSLATNHDGIEIALDGFEKRTGFTFYGGEAVPSFFPNYGPGIVAAMFGVTPKFQSGTVWFKREIKPEEIVKHLESIKFNQNNEWYSRLLKITEYAAKRAREKYIVAQSDLGGVLDILLAFLGPTNIILTMKRKPEVIDACRSIILEKLLLVYDKNQDIIDRYCDGCSNWLNIWGKKRWSTMQSDFCAMLNPKWFKRFVLPDLVTQAEHTDYAIYHLDGPNQLPHLDYILDEPSITGIQWVPGAGKAPMGSREWFPLYKKIQESGKNLVIDSHPEHVSTLYKSLDQKGLFVRAFYRSEFIAKMYMPKFMGGNEGDLIQEARQWAKKQDTKVISKDKLEEFFQLKDIRLENRLKKDILKEVNSFVGDKMLF